MNHLAVVGHLHVVLYGHFAATYLHFIYDAAGRVVIPVVTFHSREVGGVLQMEAIDGITERIFHVTVGICLGQRNFERRAVHLLVLVYLVAQIVERTVCLLFVRQFHGVVEDAAVLSIIGHHGIVYRVACQCGKASSHGFLLEGQTVGQVNDLVDHTLLEQCGITVAVDLLYLPAYGWQHQTVLASQRVGRNLDALTGGMYTGEEFMISSSAAVGDGIVVDALLGVQVVVDQPRRVVALQGEHHLHTCT